jgi:hypothetical protein
MSFEPLDDAPHILDKVAYVRGAGADIDVSTFSMRRYPVAGRDLRTPPGNHLESLTGDRAGQFSTRINDPWRIDFAWRDGDAVDVEIVDDHRREVLDDDQRTRARAPRRGTPR